MPTAIGAHRPARARTRCCRRAHPEEHRSSSSFAVVLLVAIISFGGEIQERMQGASYETAAIRVGSLTKLTVGVVVERDFALRWQDEYRHLEERVLVHEHRNAQRMRQPLFTQRPVESDPSRHALQASSCAKERRRALSQARANAELRCWLVFSDVVIAFIK